MVEDSGKIVDARFRAVADEFASYADDGDYGGQLCVIVNGRTVIDRAVGAGVDRDTLYPVFSCSKGAAAVTIGLLVQSGELDLDERVAAYWPEFGAAGKSRVTVRQALSHQAGLLDVDGGLEWGEVLDDQRGAIRLAAQRPQWQPGTAQGYHALTLGIIMGELVRRVTGTSLQALYEREIRAPRELDVYLGLPEELDDRVGSIGEMRLTPDQAAERASWSRNPDSLEHLPYAGTGWDEGGRFAMVDSREGRDAGMPAAGAFASARGLARLYAETITGLAGARILNEETETQLAQIQTARTDLVLGRHIRFAVAFQKPDPTRDFGSYRAFGHDGACGALAFADPLHGLAFGYIPRRQPYPGGCDPRALVLAAKLGAVLRGR